MNFKQGVTRQKEFKRFKNQLKGMLMLVTSILCYGFFFIISCSLLNGTSYVLAASEKHQNYDDRLTMIMPKLYAQQQFDRDNQRDHQRNANSAHAQYQKQHQHPQEANDIFTALTHTQGRINEQNNNRVDDVYIVDSSVVRPSGGESRTDDGISREPGLQEKSAKLSFSRKRYAFSTATIKTKSTEYFYTSHADRGARKKSGHQPHGKSSADITCKDESGNKVSWYVLNGSKRFIFST